jgi:hypothetical protein
MSTLKSRFILIPSERMFDDDMVCDYLLFVSGDGIMVVLTCIILIVCK